jgi:hypothetical protein
MEAKLVKCRVQWLAFVLTMLKFQALFENIYWFLSSLNVSAEFLSA